MRKLYSDDGASSNLGDALGLTCHRSLSFVKVVRPPLQTCNAFQPTWHPDPIFAAEEMAEKAVTANITKELMSAIEH
jgi:hypothetical protein